MNETVEIRNEGRLRLFASACRSKLSGKLYIHVATERKQLHGNIKKVLPNDYEVLIIGEVEG